MKERIKEKIDELQQFLVELEEIVAQDFDEYIHDIKTKAACERYAEKIIESVIDVAMLIIKEKKLPQPESDLEAFSILQKEGIISSELSIKLQDAKRMRNILVHEYGTVSDEIVFHAVSEELPKDVTSFLAFVKRGEK